MRWGLLGAAGYIAPRHMEAIRSVGGELVAACDPHDSVGILDRYAPGCEFFTSESAFVTHLEHNPVDWLTVCTPNHKHAAHARLGMRLGANVLCEKPLVATADELASLARAESTTNRRVYGVLQLRLDPRLIALRHRIATSGKRHNVQVTYLTPRGPWYFKSWKARAECSGGLLTNIGVHVFDLLLWMFGAPADGPVVRYDGMATAHGIMHLAHADVTWTLSVDPAYASKPTRVMTVDGEALDFSDGFTDLHRRVYEETLAGRGFGIDDARPALELIASMQQGMARAA